MLSQKVEVRLQTDPAGVLESPARPYPVLVVHHGVPVEIGCERGGQGHRGLSVHGDIDIVPEGTPSYWRLHKQDCALVVRLSPDLVRDAAADLGIPASEAILLNRFQIRDPKLEHLAWALKADVDAGFGSGSLYTESIGAAMACQLLGDHSVTASIARSVQPGAMFGFRLRRVVAFIEDNLSADISLADIATASGLSASHCQRAFRAAMGISLHQYVIRRRVEQARTLLGQTRLSLAEVANAVGFSHQSHLATHLRRLLGVSPAVLRRTMTDRSTA